MALKIFKVPGARSEVRLVGKELKTYCPTCMAFEHRTPEDLTVILAPSPELRFYCDGCNQAVRMAVQHFDRQWYERRGVIVIDAPVLSARPPEVSDDELDAWARDFYDSLAGDITVPQT